MKVAFMITMYLVIYFSVAMGAVWAIACIIGSRSAAAQLRHQALRKAHDHRVGGCISP
jgi:hypothetical protein